MSFLLLARHRAIAWDFDGTLIDHPKSELMHDFILASPDRRHVIVTFRSHGAEEDIWDELSRRYEVVLTPDDIQGVLNIDHAMWEAHNHATLRRRAGRLRGPWTAAEVAYMTWKGKVCHEHGLTVLVDDNVPHVIDGCTLYGIDFINPDDF